MPRTRANINQLASRNVARIIDEDINQSIRSTDVGSGLTKQVEDFPEFIAADAENVISNANSPLSPPPLSVPPPPTTPQPFQNL